jgi:hypothetical protein
LLAVPLRFSEDGPEFPAPLVDALLKGEVVFLCGAGISAPQLPGFAGLVDRCYEELNLEKDRSEQISYEAERFEEVLGSLSRRIVDPDDLVRTVSGLVKLPESPDLSCHRTILRLSRDLENRPTIVTTNFDTLIEHAWRLEDVPPEVIATASFAGQALPLPGSAGFHGIIHIHGRISDPAIGVDQSALVMTSADYGDAYMRSGWVSRFLFDLCRCKTVVLIGYSANDAPVRYFLNVLEADRTRFRDLRTVYAFDAIRGSEQDTTARWTALAVEALPYSLVTDPDGQSSVHAALWRDLEQLADLAERPKATRRGWASDLLAKPFADATQTELDWVAWLFAGQRNLFDLVINVVQDGAWLDFFTARKLWTNQEADWISAAWAGKDFCHKDRFRAALTWNAKLGKSFRSQLTFKLSQAAELSEPWRLAWRLMSISEPRTLDWDDRSYALQRELANRPVLYSDLQKAVHLLSPDLVLEPNRSELYGLPPPDPPERLADLVWTNLRLADRGGEAELIEVLLKAPEPLTVLELATASLRDAIGLGVDAEMVSADFDRLDSGVPSIEPHRQNEYRDGVIFLTQLLARILPLVSATDPSGARRNADLWRAMPGRIGLRLWLHALRDPTLYASTEAIRWIFDLPLDDFWRVHRELALVVRERAGDADQDVVTSLEHRIRTEARQHYQRYEIEDGQPDWRDYARDQEVWFRLKMLETAKVLSGAGTEELAEIISRHPHLDRAVEDRDFFKSYSFGVRSVVGDATAIVDAPDDDRLRVAQESLSDPDVEKQRGWSVFCHSNPEGALEILRVADLNDANAPLWSDLISVLAHDNQLAGEVRRTLILSVFARLNQATDQFIVQIARDLASLYWSSPRRDEPAIAAWWPRLFQAAVAIDHDEAEEHEDLADRALNSPAGRLTDALLVDLDEARKADGTIAPVLIDNLVRTTSAVGYPGALARTSLMTNLNFVLSLSVGEVNSRLAAELGGDGWEARALRKVLVSHGQLSATATRMFGPAIVDGAMSLGSEVRADWAAANLLFPVLDTVRRPHEDKHWGLGANDAAKALREGSLALRKGALEFMTTCVTQMEEGPETSWRTVIRPVLAQVWPRERRFQHPRLSRQFAKLAVGAAGAFPEALSFLLPFITPLEGHSSLYDIDASQAPQNHPVETLTLIWKLLGPDSQAESHDVPKLLDRLITSDPKLETDRRLQWLEQRYLRYE